MNITDGENMIQIKQSFLIEILSKIRMQEKT